MTGGRAAGALPPSPPPGLLPPPANAAEAFADVIMFGDDDVFQRALDTVAPASPSPDESTMSTGTQAGTGSTLRDRVAANLPARKREGDTLCGQAIDVVALTTGERNRIVDNCKPPTKGGGIILARYQVDMMVAGIYEPGTDNRVFNGKDDAALINRLPSEEVDRLTKRIEVISGMDDKAEKRAEGNSPEEEI